MMRSRRSIGVRSRSGAVALLFGLFAVACPALAGNYDESISGDLPNDPTAPQALLLSLGTNSIFGTVGSGAGADSLDAIALTVPAGMVLSGFTNAAYSGSNNQDFIGFQPGSSFVGSVFVNSAYTGLAHFGLFATNAGVGVPPGTPTSTVGVDLLPIMNTSGVVAGASGFSPPLGPGTYTFVLGPAITSLEDFPTYQFDVAVTPEPAMISLLPLALACPRRRRNESDGVNG